MALKTVKWSTNQPLPCGDCVPANVILCVKTELLDQTGFEDLDIVKKTLIATVTESSKTSALCPTYKYTFEYDDSQLADLETPLTCSDILGAFCKGCLVSWVQEQIATIVHPEAPEIPPFPDIPQYAVVRAQDNSIGVSLPLTASVTITNPSNTLEMQIFGYVLMSAAVQMAANAAVRSLTWELSIDGVSQGVQAVGNITSSPTAVINSTFLSIIDMQHLSDATLHLDPNESRTFEVEIADLNWQAGDVIGGAGAGVKIYLAGFNYIPA